MKFFFYYALHSFFNQLRKLFKTWVLIFIVACMLIGGLIGLGAAKLGEMTEADEPPQTEIQPPEEEMLEEAELSADKLAVIELIAGGVVLLVLLYDVLSADKNGSRIFLPADVNLLFPSPMKPQSVLMFRLSAQLGATAMASIYLLFQIPNLVLNVGMSLWGALAVIAAWLLTVMLGRLLQVLLYILCSNHPGLKQNLRRAVYALLALLAGGWFLFWRRSGLGVFRAASAFFNAPGTRYIPLWGWLKGFCLCAVEGRTVPALAFLGLLLLLGAGLLWIIGRSHADFYEDALARSEETAELLARAQSEKSSGLVFAKRKKDRSESLRRDQFHRGLGAGVFFHKSLYNRFRFAHLGFFTKTSETYLVLGLGAAALCRFVLETRSFVIPALALAGLAFFRALGNPLEQDTKMDFFRLIPESPWRKLFASLMGGTVNCLLDLLPGLLLGALLLRASLLEALAWIPFILSIDLYATCVGTFIDLSVPVAAGKTIKQIVQVMFVYFGLLPDVAIMAVGLALGFTVPAAIAAAALNLTLGGIFFALSPLFLEPGRGKPASDAPDSCSIDRKAARRVFSRIGLGAFAVLIVGSALQIGLSFLLPADDSGPDWLFWVVTFAPLYLVAFPIGWLLVRKLPVGRRGDGRYSAGAFVQIVLIAVFLMYAGNMLGTGINAALQVLLGTSDGNPVLTYAMADSLPLKLLFMVVLAPLAEECFFRRLLIDRMRPYGERLAVVTSALMFGMFHGNLSQFFYAALLGALFGYVYLKTGKLRYTVALHMFINTLGSVIGPAVLENVSAAAAGIAALDALDPGVLRLGLYSGTLILLALIGLVLLIVRSRRIVFDTAPQELPKGSRFSIAWLNPGMILFALSCLGIMVFTLL